MLAFIIPVWKVVLSYAEVKPVLRAAAGNAAPECCANNPGMDIFINIQFEIILKDSRLIRNKIVFNKLYNTKDTTDAPFPGYIDM